MKATDLLIEIEKLGRNQATMGYRRYSWTEADRELRDWFCKEAAARNFSVEADGNGNLWAYRGDPAKGHVVATGSHLDSVPDGGPFDGPLGIASVWAALDLLDEQAVELRRPVAVVAFVEEEGARFGVPCLGSRLLTGAMDPQRASVLTDAKGITWPEAMRQAGQDPSLLGPDKELLSQTGCFVELHIEQGRALEPLDAPIGIGTEIWPHGRWRLTFEGEANHAGTTSMEERNDPMPRMATTVLEVTETAQSIGARATVGRLQVEPNGTNAISSRVTAWLDARAENQSILDELVARLPDESVLVESHSPAVAFDPVLQQRISEVLGSPPHLPTAAGHDAGILQSAGIPTAMLFVRNPSGVSHSPLEHADPDDIDAGVMALAKVITDLAGS
ncbi:MAG: allantoate amidohydrolase [Acidimicrobiia bacterium]